MNKINQRANTATVENRHVYEYAVDIKSDSAPSQVVQLVGTSKCVLEIGCGPGSITKLLSLQGQCQVTGLELDPAAIEKVAPYCESVIQADLNNPEWPRLLEDRFPFDVVVAADVLEHLYDPWSTLKQMSVLIGSDGYLVISLPHVGHAAIAACLVSGDFQYRDWGLLDRTHIRFFGLKNIQDLFSQADMKIIEVRYVVKPPEETEFASSWNSLPEHMKSSLRSYAHSNIYQVVIKAVPSWFPGDPISLQAPLAGAVRPRSASYLKNIRMRIAKRLDRNTKQRIRRLLSAINIKL